MNTNTFEFKAPATGKCVPVEAIHNALLSTLTLGNGIAVFPENGTVLAPCHAIVTRISADKKSITLSCVKSALSVLICVDSNVDVAFTPVAATGKMVTCGEPLFTFDAVGAAAQDSNTSVVLLVTNSASVDEFKPSVGHVDAGQSCALSISCISA